MDLSTTTAPRSDQQNFDDYQAGPKTVTITEVTAGSEEQPVEIHLQEFPGRPYKPSKSMRRVLVAAWGKDGSTYTGRRMTLIGDPSVRFGGSVVGGIKISHLSNISKPVTLALTASKGRRAPHTVQPLPASAPVRDFLTELARADNPEEIAELGSEAAAAGVNDEVLGKIRDAYKRAIKEAQQ